MSDGKEYELRLNNRALLNHLKRSGQPMRVPNPRRSPDFPEVMGYGNFTFANFTICRLAGWIEKTGEDETYEYYSLTEKGEALTGND
jgi:hypothetical protein